MAAPSAAVGVFRAAALPGDWVVFRADAATGRSPWERRELCGNDGREKKPLDNTGESVVK